MTSVIIRGVVKIVFDFTLMVQLRHPGEIGGMCWSWSLVQNQLFCFGSIYLYKKFSVSDGGNVSVTRDAVDVEGGGGDTDLYDIPAGCNTTETINLDGSLTTETICPENIFEDALVKMIVVLFLTTVIGFVLFWFTINKKYWRTFTDTRTAKEFFCNRWTNATSDKLRFRIFQDHKSYYNRINKEVKVWLAEGWDTWQEEKEDWFVARVGLIPLELLPEKEKTRRTTQNLKKKMNEGNGAGEGGVESKGG